jgi:putative inorganic carbon (hco3(-)) transporter
VYTSGARTAVVPAPTLPASTPSHTSVMLSVLVALSVGLAPIQGYLIDVNGSLAKLAPASLVVAWTIHHLRLRTLPRMHALSWLCVALLGVVAASCAVNTDNPFVVESFIRWLPFLVLCIVLVDCLSSVVAPRLAVMAMATGAVIAGSGALVSFLLLGAPRAFGPMNDPNDLAYVLVAALPLLLIGVTGQRSTWRRVLGVAGAAIALGGATATLSRGGAVAVVALLVWAGARRLLSLRAFLIAMAISVAAISAGWAIAGQQIQTALNEKLFIANTNIATRELRWEAAAHEMMRSPVFGVGPGGAKADYDAVSHNAEVDAQDSVTHNMYLEVGAELGVTGLALFVSTIGIAFVATTRAASADARIALAIQGSLVAVCAASTFLSEEYYMPLWAGLAIAAALELRNRPQARQ